MSRMCTWCYKEFDLSDIKDNLSKKEALISGFCQECQDKTFVSEEEAGA